MFAVALIVFRESLEAALFIGIVAAATRGLVKRGRWLAAGVVVGALGALALAGAAQRLSAWADGIGQDLVNIGVLATALLMLLWHCVWVSTHSREMVAQARQLGASVQGGQRRPWALLVAVTLAVLREGAETVLFIGGALTGTTQTTGTVLAAGSAGLGAGALLGALLYLGLSRIPVQRLFSVTNVLVALLAASIASQLAKALSQAGLLNAWNTPLWDSSAALATGSPLGTVLHALVGYEAQPSGVQLAAYAAVLAFIALGTRWLSHAPGLRQPPAPTRRQPRVA